MSEGGSPTGSALSRGVRVRIGLNRGQPAAAGELEKWLELEKVPRIWLEAKGGQASTWGSSPSLLLSVSAPGVRCPLVQPRPWGQGELSLCGELQVRGQQGARGPQAGGACVRWQTHRILRVERGRRGPEFGVVRPGLSDFSVSSATHQRRSLWILE